MKFLTIIAGSLLITGQLAFNISASVAQTAPSKTQVKSYEGLHKAAHVGDLVVLSH